VYIEHGGIITACVSLPLHQTNMMA